MTSWSRRLNAAARTGVPTPGTQRGLLADAVEVGVSADDQAALTAMANIARDRPGFKKVLQVTGSRNGAAVLYDFEVRYEPGGPVVKRLGESKPSVADAASASPEPADEGAETSGTDIVNILTDTLVETSDLVAIFASVGHEAIWANDAFVTVIPIRESDKIWLVELLDEWSKGHYEVKVLPALVKYGRWRGRLTLLTGDEETLTVSAVIVAHRDRRGEITAVSMVARPFDHIGEAPGGDVGGMARFEALVENAADIIAVADADGLVEYASPAAARILGLMDGALTGNNLLELVHPDDRPASLVELVNVDDLGIGEPVELRLRSADDTWRHLEVVVSDLSDNPAIAGFVLNARDVTERVKAVSELATKAYHDALTGLPGRVRILDRLAGLLGDRNTATTVLMLDFDRFTGVNETYGRPAGDEVLRTLAQRLADNVDAGQLVGRLGSDEFVVVLETGDAAEGVRVANRLRAATAVPIEVEGEQVEVTSSVGVAIGQPGDEAEQLLLDAGRAMAHAKSSGRDRVEVFSEQLAQIASRRRTVEQQLRRALDNDGVSVHYQPIVDVESEETIGAEALLRVHDEEGALLSPAEFIEAAESTGLIARLGGQVLQLTCEQLAAWSANSGLNLREISVNVSPRQLADPELPTKVVDALNSAGVAPERLCLEIGESILIGAQATVDASISYLRALGVRIGLDDFGAGQSSLGYLKRFPLDFVKIDKTLIAGLGTDEQDTAIVRATIELAHNLGLTVVAVGVEYDEQLEMLQILGCDRAQGYLFSRPLPADQFAQKAERRLR